MTCIISVFTPEKIIISEDSAVSSDTRTYTGVEKTTVLSQDPPMTISCYGNSDFEDMPLENIISEYIKQTDFEKINTIVKVKKDFLNYVHNVMPKGSIEDYLNKKLTSFKETISKLDNNELRYYSYTEYEQTTLPLFKEHEFDFNDIISEEFSDEERNNITKNLNNIFLSSLLNELSGIVIIGIDKKTMKNGYTKFEMLFNGKNNVLVCNEEEKINIKKTEINVFAQNDVVKGFLYGIDVSSVETISQEIEKYNNDTLDTLLKNLKNSNISKDDFKKILEEIEVIRENSIVNLEFKNYINNLGRIKMENIIDEIEIMPKWEIMKMNKTLINLTRLKRIISSEQVTVDGDVKHFVLSLKNGIEKFYLNNAIIP